MKAPFGAAKSDLWTAVVIGVLVVGGTIIDAVRRLTEIIPNRDVPVEVAFENQEQVIPVEGVGPAIPVELVSGTVHVSDLPVASYVAALAATVVPAITVIAVTVCLSWFFWNLANGEFFSRTNTRLITTTSFLIVGGWLLSTMASTVAANGALARLSDGVGDFEVSMTLSFLYLFVAMGVGCLGAAFHAGERLQRDTAGLV